MCTVQFSGKYTVFVKNLLTCEKFHYSQIGFILHEQFVINNLWDFSMSHKLVVIVVIVVVVLLVDTLSEYIESACIGLMTMSDWPA